MLPPRHDKCSFVTPLDKIRQQQRRRNEKLLFSSTPLLLATSNLRQLESTSSSLYMTSIPQRDITAAVTATSASTTTPTFDAIVPDTTILVGFGMIVIICTIAAYVWANQVVPISRTKLALAKQKNSNSSLRQYLDELLELEKTGVEAQTTLSLSSDIGTTVDAATSAASVEKIDSRNVFEEGHVTDHTINATSLQIDRKKGDRALERWLFTDWLVKDSTIRKGGRKKEPAIPILKNAKWNSGDNPVLVATTLIFLGVLFTSVTERITTLVTN
jgi:hypothetical protein